MVLKNKKGASLLLTIVMGIIFMTLVCGATIWLSQLNKASVGTKEKMDAMSYAYNKIISYQSTEYSEIKALQNTEKSETINGYIISSTFGNEQIEYGVNIIPIIMTVQKDNKPLYTYIYERRSDDTEYYTKSEMDAKYNIAKGKLNTLIDKRKQVDNKINQINAHNSELDKLNARIKKSNENIAKSNAQVDTYNKRVASIQNGDFLIKKENAGSKYYTGTCDTIEVGYCLSNIFWY